MTQAGLWIGAGSSMGLAVGAGLAEWRRARRRSLDRVGWVPWTGIQVAALFAAAILAILALKT
ncbi:MAG: hypothetical protein H0W74_05740 [Sphingosinicella sp.]|nr:hypothetical protein [Sphingosinicella sp.]